ncbi:hypothetical protein M378DRAFT_193550 [Amanita muscaria Koide BX008]|uniref:WD40 repeat-like protein n=1 Tax=Amanita muscaria (strain Koide BX008) TaxID=946122 RepID=A0A0C2WX28_AMAMK|nr:hypothetical protein M378DRAFT_193550 [Amanita muscaria Koide BX008]
MIQTGLVPNAHDDLVTDASYDYYGLHLATCSLDQRIKIWKLNENDGSWNVEDDWKAHDAPVSKVSWAHPEFGTIVASSSFDRTVKIWEQTASPNFPKQPIVNGSTPQATPSRWVERAMLPDAKASVRAVEFAPHRVGLKLATISSDNHLRFYECLEPSTLTSWQLTEEVDISNIPATPPHSSLSRPHTVAPATPTQTSTVLDGAATTQVAQVLQQNLQQSSSQTRSGTGNREADGGWCISWCKERYWGEVIAVASGTSGVVRIIQVTPSRRPTTILSLDPAPAAESSVTQPQLEVPVSTSDAASTAGAPGAAPATTKEPNGPASFSITSVSWAASCGRSYHLIATGGRDGHVRIWRVRPAQDDDAEVFYDEAAGTTTTHAQGRGEGGESEDGNRWSASVVADFDHHRSTVGRVEWNITGTVLSSAGNDGRIRLWKATIGNVWRPAGSIGVEQDDQPRAADHSGQDVEME